MSMALAEKVAIVTGGASGIGFATVEVLLREGAKVTVVGRREMQDLPAEFQQLAAKEQGRLLYLSCDVSRITDCEQCVQKTVAHFGRADILVNAAGRYLEKLFCEVTEADFDDLMAVNVKGSYFMARSVLNAMRRGGGGAIVNISSDAGLQGNLQCTLYCATKGAINAFTKALALEVAPYGIRVNAVCPGDIKTVPLSIESERSLAEVYPLGRIGLPHEVAEVVLFLCSEQSSFVTGALWSVDGGLTAG